MEKSVRGLLFTLDPQTAPPLLRVSPSGLTVTFLEQTHLDCCYRGTEAVSENQRAEPPHLPQVCAGVCINRGQFYWEVDVYNSASYRIGLCSVEGIQDWWFERQGSSFSVLYDGSREQLHSVPPQVKTLGVFLNLGGGAVSFHNTVVQEHLATLPTRFGGAVRPALCLGQGRLRIRCGLPPPPHVFSSCRSGYRSPRGSSRRGWHRDVPFHSVRSVIQKFEELSVSDSDSGLISSFGSCSTLNSSSSLLDPGK
ncbi:probable E3 ubiquitin-protein ligase MID2 [Amia ocellicauda]|uniref:probable E3 ubiquitin-protein ligase MID2 n=1 Tax=Amia ocellicauda TaxID=2972642 RepID=UPI003464ABEF